MNTEKVSNGQFRYVWRPQVTDGEIHAIGTIFVQWSCLEHEIFVQTLMTFEAEIDAAGLPKEMNNMQFSSVLELWKTRVVDAMPSPKGDVLREQYLAIIELKTPRDALAHGMWEWSPETPTQISTIRVKKTDMISSHFTADYLHGMATKLGEINFKVRFPGGADDLVAAQMAQGGYFSRHALTSLMKASPDAE